jgi:TonB family protein
VLHFDDLGPDAPRLPNHPLGFVSQVATSALIHGAIVLTIITIGTPHVAGELHRESVRSTSELQHIDLRRVVFIASNLPNDPSGGGGGGNRRPGPIRRAEGIGLDLITLRVTKLPFPPEVTVEKPSSESVPEVAPLPPVLVDAKLLASGTTKQVGLPTGGATSGASTGPGAGGGVGTGFGTGIGSGTGPGIGPGFGGGIGGGVYRPGGAVTAPRVITEVKPKYTSDALQQKIQGTVVLELVVTRDGLPSQIRVIRSLDPEGLDEEAIAAAAQWRFEPGRRGGAPVDVLVTLMLDFCIW